MLATEKIQKAKEYLEQAEQCIKEDNKRVALGKLDFVQDNIEAAKWLIINELRDNK